MSLALGLPSGELRELLLLLPVCYGVVVFTIIVQGLTMERVARSLYSSSKLGPQKYISDYWKRAGAVVPTPAFQFEIKLLQSRHFRSSVSAGSRSEDGAQHTMTDAPPPSSPPSLSMFLVISPERNDAYLVLFALKACVECFLHLSSGCFPIGQQQLKKYPRFLRV